MNGLLRKTKVGTSSYTNVTVESIFKQKFTHRTKHITNIKLCKNILEVTC